MVGGDVAYVVAVGFRPMYRNLYGKLSWCVNSVIRGKGGAFMGGAR